METSIWIISILSAIWIGYTYVGYPLILYILQKFYKKEILKKAVHPSVSIIIAVHNAEALLDKKLQETLDLEYPSNKQIIVTSDGSTDKTLRIAKKYENQGVITIDNKRHLGKEYAHAKALPYANNEILIFTDVRAELEPDALSKIVMSFSDPTVGSVSAKVSTKSIGKEITSEGLYTRYDMAIRQLESTTTSLVGLSGAFFAIRRSCISIWPHHLASDFRCALDTILQRYRAVLETGTIASIRSNNSSQAEWKRKVRTFCNGITVLLEYKKLLLPRYGCAAFSLWGHKVTRFTAPFAFLILFIASGIGSLLNPYLFALFGLQLIFYFVGCAAFFVKKLNSIAPIRIINYLLLSNAAVLVAWFYYLRGERFVRWDPTIC